MNLKRFSLGEGNSESNSYIIAGNIKNPPCLKLPSDRVSFQLYKECFVHICKDNVNSSGTILSFTDDTSKHPITDMIQNCESFCAQDMANMQDFNDVLILGALCESICKIAVPIKVLIENAETINQFIKESFEYFKVDTHNYQFDFYRAFDLLKEEKSNEEKATTKKLILLGRASDMEVYCKARLSVNRNHISIKNEEMQNSGINVPQSIASSKLSSKELNCLYDAIIWILLADSGFYLKGDNSFYNFGPKLDYRMRPHLFFNHIAFNPRVTIKVFDDDNQ